jgi:RimJ/RimL family protein N-acetyltransferase
MPFRVRLAFVLARPYWGRGYITEAARTLIEWAFYQPEIYRVEAYCDVENRASIRVLEKIGMQREGVLRRSGYAPNLSEEPRDSFCYAKVR